MHKSALCRHLGKGWGTIGYHLHKLERVGEVNMELCGTRLWVFQPDLLESDRRLIVALADENRKAVLRHLHDRKGATIQELSKDLEFSHKVVRTHLSHLMDAGAVERRGSKPHRYRLMQRFWNWIKDL